MKKIKLRMWIKVVIVLVAFGMLNGVITKKGINDCVNSGNDISYCENVLK